MNGWTILLVGVGAAVGAPVRFLVDTAVKARLTTTFPWGTFVVNAAGSLVLGLVTGAATPLGPGVVALIGTGFCGALTTYSTFSHELVSLTERGAGRSAALYLLASLLVGIAAAAAGFALARTLL